MLYRKLLLSLFFLTFSLCNAQEKNSLSIFFDFDKYTIRQNELSELIDFVKDIEKDDIEDIEIFGYCDDRGGDDYNFKLSMNRANALKEALLNEGIQHKIIITIEGRGKVAIDNKNKKHLKELRQKNRRVDIFLNYKIVSDEKNPNIYTDFPDEPVEGDRIILNKILFDQGRSRITRRGKMELRKIVQKIKEHENISFEIHGHICCTPRRYKDAIDKDTRKRELSLNRAKKIYEYFLEQKISENQMKYMGCGSGHSLNGNPAMDRRVEIYITPF